MEAMLSEGLGAKLCKGSKANFDNWMGAGLVEG
jgi:hypothetical protein